MNKKIKVIPLCSVNGAEFGEGRDYVRAKLGSPECTFKKNIDDKVETDGYDNAHVFYNDDLCFEAVEFFYLDELELYYGDERLSAKYSELLTFFKRLYNDIEEDGAGFISKAGSVGVYIDNDEDEADSILFGGKAYYSAL